MNKFVWKIEYSLTLMAIFVVILFMVPTSFTSHTAEYISRWNDAYNKVDYMFTAMSAHAESEIVLGIKNAKDNEKRENMMVHLVKPYLRLEELDRKYKPRYMNGSVVKDNDYYKFNNLYISDNERVVGIKVINFSDTSKPAFIMMFDMNGIKGPNTWGKDIYGVSIFFDGTIKALGYDKSIDELKKDCSPKGTGISCSYFYRIGGEFNE